MRASSDPRRHGPGRAPDRLAAALLLVPAVATLRDARLGHARAALVRDPDGHALLLAQPAGGP